MSINFSPKYWVVILFSFFLLSFNNMYGQNHSRIKAGFSIKEKKSNGKSQLTTGTVYYDIKANQIVYVVSFPEKEIWVITEKNSYLIINDSIIKKDKSNMPIDKSLLHLFLTNTLNNFGISASLYQLSSTNNADDGSVEKTWLPKKKREDLFGKIIMSTTNNRLNGIALYNSEQLLQKRYIYKDYTAIANMQFPSKVIEIAVNQSGKEDYILTSYMNVVVDQKGEDKLYEYLVH